MSKRKIKKICFILLSILLGLSLSEMLLRLTPNIKVSTVKWVPNSMMGAIMAPNQQARFSSMEFDNVVLTNSAGYHDFEYTYKKSKDTFRILVLGDSFVEGVHVKRHELFFNILQKQLNQNTADKKYEVVAIARSGWGTAQELKVFEEYGLKYQPDLVILALLPGNDFGDSHLLLKKDVHMPYYQIKQNGLSFVHAQQNASLNGWFYTLYKSSQLLCFLKQNLSTFRKGRSSRKGIPSHLGLYVRNKGKDWQEAVEITSLCLKRMNEICQEKNINFLCLVLDDKALMGEETGVNYKKTYPNLSLEEYDFYYPYTFLYGFCKKHNIQQASLLKYFQQDFKSTEKRSHFVYDGHWNEYGHSLTAKFLYEYLSSRPHLMGKSR
ncbi:SGNH/GDSL hydrolase family protein [Candidatus Uabimicrobium amorphum]|uniref:SGNH hydrolase-type esterase domain-containing protein n=1 Tax=Uabimicrobium amorphum TaxID=2596890 RepID=A0A5S9F1U6_UABAM|nr:SGNH/GDSL hydrolase family protein [Candidatus Uabimicrobium amorphum]BBM81694.1 hypothetical protein UABAM_00033 [Candidatus Uabimicrobium amorphum]